MNINKFKADDIIAGLDQSCFFDNQNYFIMKHKHEFLIEGIYKGNKFSCGPFSYYLCQQVFTDLANTFEKFLKQT